MLAKIIRTSLLFCVIVNNISHFSQTELLFILTSKTPFMVFRRIFLISSEDMVIENFSETSS